MVLAVTATAAEALPATIASRCQKLDLRPVVPQVLETALRERGFPPPKAELLASLSGGRVGWAISAGESDTVLRQRGRDLDRLVELLAADRLERLDFAARINRDPGLARRRIEMWTSWWRDLLLLSNQVDDGVINTDRLDELRLVAEQVTPSEVLAGMNTLQATAVQLEANVNTRLAVEGLLLALPHWSWLPQSQAHYDHKRAPTP
jgi:DNA polymerase-3 subunit delta'